MYSTSLVSTGKSERYLIVPVYFSGFAVYHDFEPNLPRTHRALFEMDPHR